MKNLLILITVSLFIAGCNKEPEYETRHLDSGLKTAFNNKPGSYWIYKDSVSGQTDSVYLIASTLKINTGDARSDGFNYEELNLNFDSRHFGADTSYNLVLGMDFDTRNDHYFVCGLKKITTQPLNFWFTYPISYPRAVNKDDTIIITEIKSPFVLGDKTFSDVKRIDQFKKANPIKERASGIWSNTYGIIKLRFTYRTSFGDTTKVLELYKYKLIK